jgi:hypothetical protein
LKFQILSSSQDNIEVTLLRKVKTMKKLADTSVGEFADDFFWWIKKYNNISPSEFTGKFVLIYRRVVVFQSESESRCIDEANKRGYEGLNYVIMAVDVVPQRELLHV